ncbi:MAG: hypothetical protein LC672_00375, partial [Acidobacteria bacterium]|nr:hypothetical protein [Acidobacteriota bacterium]
MRRQSLIQTLGLVWTLLYAAFIIWLYATQPRTLADVAAGARVATQMYEVDEARFEAAREMFRREQYRAARDEWARADPARGDART